MAESWVLSFLCFCVFFVFLFLDVFFVFVFVRFCLAIAGMPSRNCQWLHSSDIAIANVPSRNCQCMCKRTVKKLHSEGVPFCFNLILGGASPPRTLNKYHLIMNATHYLGGAFGIRVKKLCVDLRPNDIVG